MFLGGLDPDVVLNIFKIHRQGRWYRYALLGNKCTGQDRNLRGRILRAKRSRRLRAKRSNPAAQMLPELQDCFVASSSSQCPRKAYRMPIQWITPKAISFIAFGVEQWLFSSWQAPYGGATGSGWQNITKPPAQPVDSLRFCVKDLYP